MFSDILTLHFCHFLSSAIHSFMNRTILVVGNWLLEILKLPSHPTTFLFALSTILSKKLKIDRSGTKIPVSLMKGKNALTCFSLRIHCKKNFKMYKTLAVKSSLPRTIGLLVLYLLSFNSSIGRSIK